MSLSSLQSKMETQIASANDDLFNELKHSIDTEAQPANEEEFRTAENKTDGVKEALSKTDHSEQLSEMQNMSGLLLSRKVRNQFFFRMVFL